MKQKTTFLITGSTGFLGQMIVKQLLQEGKTVIGLKLAGDKRRLHKRATYICGDVSDKRSLKQFFEAAKDKKAVLIHCAGVVTIASEHNRLWNVNVDGTRNIVDMCEQYRIERLVYVSSVHAIPEDKSGGVITEADFFSASRVQGIYGKSKAEATAYVWKAMERGLPACIVFPSGIIGPQDYSGGYMTQVIQSYLKGLLVLGVDGGYDFVDVRDVAAGICTCCDKGRNGESYILSNEYSSIRRIMNHLAKLTGKKKITVYIPLKPASFIAPISEKISSVLHLPQIFTPYSIYALGSNGHFSHEKATKELGYKTRAITNTLMDTINWMQKTRI